jgi:hypothetical protein
MEGEDFHGENPAGWASRIEVQTEFYLELASWALSIDDVFRNLRQLVVRRFFLVQGFVEEFRSASLHTGIIKVKAMIFVTG